MRGGAAPERGPGAHWKLSDALILVVAAMRVILPYVAVILATVLAAWGLLGLVFR